MLWRRMVWSGCLGGVWHPVKLGGGRGLSQFAGEFVAFLKGGNLLRNVIFFNNEVFRAKTRDIVSFAIRDSNVELHQNDVDAETRCLVLGCRTRRGGQEKKKTQP